MASQNTILNTIFISPLQGVDINKLIADAIEKNDDRLIELNTTQLDRGLDMKGKSLGRYRRFKYKNRYEPIDLKLTGEYRRKKTLTAGKNKAEMFSQDAKAPKLEKRFGKDIEGVPSSNMDRVGDIILPSIQEDFKKQVLVKGFLRK